MLRENEPEYSAIIEQVDFISRMVNECDSISREDLLIAFSIVLNIVNQKH